ncbi:MAG: RNA polymerase sigma factor [Ktedonobacteraceae bacterium]
MPVLTLFEPEILVEEYAEDKLADEAIDQQETETLANVEKNDHYKLVARALDGDQEAFNDIVTQYSSLMLRTACVIIGDRDTAEDVVQDALIQVWHHLPELREVGALRSWLMRIVVNQCISFKRRLARSTAFIRQLLSEQETDLMAQLADDHKGRMERDWDLAEAIKQLPTKQRAALVLHYYHAMTLPEMAQALQTSENTLKKRIQAALVTLRRTLQSNEMDDTYPVQAPKLETRVFATSLA